MDELHIEKPSGFLYSSRTFLKTRQYMKKLPDNSESGIQIGQEKRKRGKKDKNSEISPGERNAPHSQDDK